MFDAFNDTSRLSVVEAQVVADDLDHDYVGVEHLLIGLLTVPSEASRTLSAAGLDATAARARVVELVGRRPRPETTPVVGHRMAEMVAGARVVAVRRRHRLIAACHLGVALFAHLDDPSAWRGLDAPWGRDLPTPHPHDHVATRVLDLAGVRPVECRDALLGVLDAAVADGVLEVAPR